MPALFQLQALLVGSFSTGRAKRLVRFFLNSSSDRRVLDKRAPDPNQSARDRQSINNRPEGVPLGARAKWGTAGSVTGLPVSLLVKSLLTLPCARRVLSIQSIHCETCKRLANPRPARLTYQLEARSDHFTIFSNVTHHNEHQIFRYARLKAPMPADPNYRSTSLWQTFQETRNTQWQKN